MGNEPKFGKIRDMNLKYKQIKNDGAYYNLNLTPRKNSSDNIRQDEDKIDKFDKIDFNKMTIEKNVEKNEFNKSKQQPIEYESRRNKNKTNSNLEKVEKGKLEQFHQSKSNQSKNTLIQVKQDMNEIFESRRNVEHKI